MATYNSFTFGTINSADFGIYIGGEGTFNAPERRGEMITIPGKNGALFLDEGAFENIELTYPAFNYEEDLETFRTKLADLRNALCSQIGYQRLADTFHPDEYRLAVFKSGLDVSPIKYNTASEFNIVFDCKPQRFLVDGDREILPTEWSDVQTATGEIVTIDSDGSLAVKALEVSLSPIQAGSGEPSPSNVRPISGRTEVVTQRTGKNLLKNIATSATINGVTFTVNADGSITTGGTATAYVDFWVTGSNYYEDISVLEGKILSGCPSGGSSSTYRLSLVQYGDGAGRLRRTDEFGSGVSLSIADGATRYAVAITIQSGANVDNLTFYPMIRESGQSATYEPYQGASYTTALGRTVYGGTLDVVSGVLTVDKVGVDLGSFTWAKVTGNAFCNFTTPELTDINYIASEANYISSLYKAYSNNSAPESGDMYIWVNKQKRIRIKDLSKDSLTVAEFKTAMSGQTFVYELATPQTYQLTPQQIDLLLGTNHLWSDGEITVEYGVHPYYNPTPFDAKPLIKVTGRGTLGIGEYILTITGTASQKLYIDCETMEIYTLEGTVPTGASSLVSINKNDFPVLKSGTNYISVGSGITAVTITPRWWRI